MSNAADGGNLLLGKGRLYFERFSAAGAAATGAYRYLGNVTAFGITMSDETKEAYSSAEAGAPLLKQALIRRTVELAITMDEFTADNVALALMGTSTDAALQTAGAVTGADGGIATPDRIHSLPAHHYNATVAAVVKVGTTTLTGGAVDYVVDYVNGTVYLLPSAAVVAACDGTKHLLVDVTTAAYAVGVYKNLVGATVGVVEGAFMFIGDPSSGPKFNVNVWRVDVTPDGEWGLVADDFGEFKVKGKVIADTVAHPTSALFSLTKMS